MRLFVAVWPPPEVVGLIAGLERPVRPGVRWTASDKWHVTLRFLGEVADVEVVKDALGRLERVGGGALTAGAGPVVQRLGSSVLCLPVAGLDDLATEVTALTADIGRAPDTRPFLGHLTLARGQRGADLRPLAGASLSATWDVREVALVASRLHPDGARYQVMAHHHLGAPG